MSRKEGIRPSRLGMEENAAMPEPTVGRHGDATRIDASGSAETPDDKVAKTLATFFGGPLPPSTPVIVPPPSIEPLFPLLGPVIYDRPNFSECVLDDMRMRYELASGKTASTEPALADRPVRVYRVNGDYYAFRSVSDGRVLIDHLLRTPVASDDASRAATTVRDLFDKFRVDNNILFRNPFRPKTAPKAPDFAAIADLYEVEPMPSQPAVFYECGDWKLRENVDVLFSRVVGALEELSKRGQLDIEGATAAEPIRDAPVPDAARDAMAVFRRQQIAAGNYKTFQSVAAARAAGMPHVTRSASGKIVAYNDEYKRALRQHTRAYITPGIAVDAKKLKLSPKAAFDPKRPPFGLSTLPVFVREQIYKLAIQDETDARDVPHCACPAYMLACALIASRGKTAIANVDAFFKQWSQIDVYELVNRIEHRASELESRRRGDWHAHSTGPYFWRIEHGRMLIEPSFPDASILLSAPARAAGTFAGRWIAAGEIDVNAVATPETYPIDVHISIANPPGSRCDDACEHHFFVDVDPAGGQLGADQSRKLDDMDRASRPPDDSACDPCFRCLYAFGVAGKFTVRVEERLPHTLEDAYRGLLNTKPIPFAANPERDATFVALLRLTAGAIACVSRMRAAGVDISIAGLPVREPWRNPRVFVHETGEARSIADIARIKSYVGAKIDYDSRAVRTAPADEVTSAHRWFAARFAEFSALADPVHMWTPYVTSNPIPRPTVGETGSGFAARWHAFAEVFAAGTRTDASPIPLETLVARR